MKKILFCLLFLALSPGMAMAANCSAYPYTLTNGTTADANQVMADFNTILSCGNSNLLGVNNNLSDLQSASAARSNLGLGSAATKNATDSGTIPVSSVNTNVAITDYDIATFTGTNGTIADSGINGTQVLTKTGNLAGLSNTATAQTNLGLSNGATTSITISTSAPSGTPAGGAGSLWLEYTP